MDFTQNPYKTLCFQQKSGIHIPRQKFNWRAGARIETARRRDPGKSIKLRNELGARIGTQIAAAAARGPICLVDGSSGCGRGGKHCEPMLTIRQHWLKDRHMFSHSYHHHPYQRLQAMLNRRM